jgi:hypothetical protein
MVGNLKENDDVGHVGIDGRMYRNDWIHMAEDSNGSVKSGVHSFERRSIPFGYASLDSVHWEIQIRRQCETVITFSAVGMRVRLLMLVRKRKEAVNCLTLREDIPCFAMLCM